jgi:hypothetical protein
MRSPYQLQQKWVSEEMTVHAIIKETQVEAYNQALSDFNQEIGKTILDVKVKEIIDQTAKMLMK